MTYLAYDPERIGALAAAVRVAENELAGLSCDDPLAADALARVRLARLHLAQLWLPVLDRLVAADPLARLAATPPGDLTLALVRAAAALPGWRLTAVTAEPMGALPDVAPTPAQVRALADHLARADLAVQTDTATERARLAAQLALVAAEPTSAALFAARFDRWGELADQLGHRRQAALDVRNGPVGDDRRADAARLDTSFGAMASIWTGVHGGPGSLAELTERTEPYAAAALVARAGLDATTLAGLSVEVLRRLDHDRPGAWPEDLVGGPKSGDVLFGAILATPGTSSEFVVAVAPEPLLLWWTAADATLAQRVALTGTDPRHLGAAAAGDVLHAFTEWFATYDPLERNGLVFTAAPAASRAALGELAAPWLVQYGPAVDVWDVDRATRRADLAFVIEDDAARAALFDRMAAYAGDLRADGSRYDEDQAIAQTIGMVLQLETERRIRAGEAAKDSWDGAWGFVGTFIGYLGKQGGPEVAAITQMLTQALVEVKRVADANGWLGAPPAAGAVADQARSEQQVIRLGLAATVVRAAHDRLVSSGRLPPSPPPPVPLADRPDDLQAYARQYEDWKAAHVQRGSTAEAQLDRQFALFVSDYEIGTSPG